jgi:hypothetical protein
VNCVLKGFYDPTKGGSRIILVPLETCLKYTFSHDWYDKLTSKSTPRSDFIRRINHTVYKNHGDAYGTWDQLAMAVAIYPSLILRSHTEHISVELNDHEKRGMLRFVKNNDDCKDNPKCSLNRDVLHDAKGNNYVSKIDVKQEPSMIYPKIDGAGEGGQMVNGIGGHGKMEGNSVGEDGVNGHMNGVVGNDGVGTRDNVVIVEEINFKRYEEILIRTVE